MSDLQPLAMPLTAGREPTHFCHVCRAQWRLNLNGTWTLCSLSCGKCCDNVAMSDQIHLIDTLPERLNRVSAAAIKPGTIGALFDTGPQFRPDVVAGKYDPQLFDASGVHLLVNEVFYSLQGEGDNAGRAAVFVRLSKCNLACKFCDTEFETHTRRPIDEVVNQIRAMVPAIDPTVLGEPGSPAQAEAWVKRELNPWIILTGGEPGLQNCGPFIATLQAAGFKVAIETSGSVWADWMGNLDHICVSPKVPLDRIPEQLKITASEFKWIVNAAFLSMYERDPSKLFLPGCTNWLQPESLNPKWTLAASKLVMANPSRYSLSLQTHKLAGNP